MKQAFCILTMMLTAIACSEIPEDERLVYVEPPVVNRAVLIEDFTGQRCVNCPNAIIEIEQLEQQYGKENVIAVGIHSGPLAVWNSDRLTGLRTQVGDTYYDYWQVEVEPSGLINRKGGVALQTQWQTMVHNALQQPSPVNLSLTCHSSASDGLSAEVKAVVHQSVSGHLQLWVTEDSIVAPQMMPDGQMNSSFVHNHVLRKAVNGDWGTPVDWQPGQEYVLPFRVDLDEGWNKSHLSLVAFVYDDGGVQQVVKVPFGQHEAPLNDQ